MSTPSPARITGANFAVAQVPDLPPFPRLVRP